MPAVENTNGGLTVMKRQRNFALGLVGTLAVAGAAHAGQPKDVVTSDDLNNTAMGTNAELGLTSGGGNTAAGSNAMYSISTGDYNTAMGSETLYYNTSGGDNSAFGAGALDSNTTGNDNTAAGTDALQSNQSGGGNVAVGYQSLWRNNFTNANTAVGYEALWTNEGTGNTASGYGALYNNTSGNYNAAEGYETLEFNSTGSNNTASGHESLYKNTAGSQNAAAGAFALFANTGSSNTAVGANALYANTVGNFNIAIGASAGYDLTSGSYNIDIGSQGAAGDNHSIKIGTQGTHLSTYIAGILGNATTGSPVVIDSKGRLGVGSSSSQRFKTAIAPMGVSTSKLDQLRPVTFHLKSEPQGPLQYGLIAEEVDKVYPELVIRSEEGRIEGVRYDELAPMLLNEVQRLEAKVNQQAVALQEMQQLRQQVAELQASAHVASR
jgi:hypothetical protein